MVVRVQFQKCIFNTNEKNFIRRFLTKNIEFTFQTVISERSRFREKFREKILIKLKAASRLCTFLFATNFLQCLLFAQTFNKFVQFICFQNKIEVTIFLKQNSDVTVNASKLQKKNYYNTLNLSVWGF